MALFSISKLFGGGREGAREVKRLAPVVAQINALESAFSAFSDGDLKKKTDEFRERFAKGETLDGLLPEAFAAVREAARRTLRERHFDVQLVGGVILHRGGIAEMMTGEGKTLVATLPAYLNALAGKGVHVVTVNDYLSRRDSVWMGQVYEALGMSVACINHEQSFIYDASAKIRPEEILPATSASATFHDKDLDKKRDELGAFHVVHEFLRPISRRQAYEADITYGTNSEFGFDYLRDNLEYEGGVLRQKDFNFAIVDEIDSILIDEARTPLIISAPSVESEKLYQQFAGLVRDFEEKKDYEIDEKQKAISLTQDGITKAEQRLNVENIYTEGGIKLVHHLETAIRAKALFKKDTDYVVRDGQVIIVDTFTGRLQPGRRWSEGLHQAIEAKEGVSVQRESRTFASITYQNYFRMYKKLSGMTGTASTSSEEFLKVYGLRVAAIPTNKPSQRKDLQDLILRTERGKFKAVARKVKELNAKGQPVLIGTVSIEKNEVLSEYLSKEGIKHEILNAKNHEREGEIIAQAGRRGAVTIATNMAGRGVDIKLGGSPSVSGESDAVKESGGLFVLGTERHEARRIDNQLRGRSGRQGDPGATQFFVSLEDTLMRVFAKDTIGNLMGRIGLAEDEPIENRLITKSIETAQKKIEGFHFDSRKHVLEFDDVLNHQRKIVYERRRKILLDEAGAVETFLASVSQIVPEAEQAVIQKKNETGQEAFHGAVRRLILQTNDWFWVDHLEAMDYLRGSVNLRSFGQRDPLVEYRREGLKMFKDMETAVRVQVAQMIPAIGAGAFLAAQKELEDVRKKAKEIAAGDGGDSAPAPIRSSKEVGRNDPCPCGSGKKYKRCHLNSNS
ncbi:MAG: preprotein translocase subunit SecA [Candidatus Taylorbacteria bacterium RIFCSPLOWO2_02_FULL_46_40]|uniref:Protein translocase subunit SecA n=1 Tax=Candidatus Taylorbacteria bacterium RIFCSPLOWO2_02_FULL_46_40 TaxID=1802329 RepID=A0A1G2NZW1_9BACT|nr:MAG: preprotein translocase subunit SecA [Candidatus Taylorbacteria bacterium RIFCSPLOWO2_02_FULL_46_40]